MNTIVEVATRANKEAAEVVTNLTVNWDGMTEDDVRALAQQALIVKLQSSWRKSGIPEGDHTVAAVEHKVGSRAPRKPADVFALAQALSPEQKAELLAKLMG